MLMLPRRHPRTSHSESYLFSDSPGGVHYYLLHRYFWFDINGQVDAEDVIWAVHWSTAAQGGYHWWLNHDGVVVRDPRPHVKIWHRTTDDWSRLRTHQHGGRGPAKMIDMVRQVHDYDQAHKHFKNGHRVYRVPMIEAKGSPAFQRVATWQKFDAQVKEFGGVYGVMTLQDIKGWARRLAAVHRVGRPTALLPRLARPLWWGRKRPAYVQQVWGSFRHRKA